MFAVFIEESASVDVCVHSTSKPGPVDHSCQSVQVIWLPETRIELFLTYSFLILVLKVNTLLDWFTCCKSGVETMSFLSWSVTVNAASSSLSTPPHPWSWWFENSPPKSLAIIDGTRCILELIARKTSHESVIAWEYTLCLNEMSPKKVNCRTRWSLRSHSESEPDSIWKAIRCKGIE